MKLLNMSLSAAAVAAVDMKAMWEVAVVLVDIGLELLQFLHHKLFL